MDAGACVGAKGWGYARGGGTFCLHVWESVVSAGWRVCVCGGGWRRCCYSRLPVNNARGECFMARAGL